MPGPNFKIDEYKPPPHPALGASGETHKCVLPGVVLMEHNSIYYWLRLAVSGRFFYLEGSIVDSTIPSFTNRLLTELTILPTEISSRRSKWSTFHHPSPTALKMGQSSCDSAAIRRRKFGLLGFHVAPIHQVFLYLALFKWCLTVVCTVFSLWAIEIDLHDVWTPWFGRRFWQFSFQCK